jgi:hypothetical protein
MAYGPNLLTGDDADFESTIGNWVELGGSGQTVARATANPRTGSGHARCTQSSATGAERDWIMGIPHTFSAAGTYEMEGYITGPVGGTDVAVNLTGYAGSATVSETRQAIGASYVKVVKRFTIADGDKIGELWFRCLGTAPAQNDEVDMDDIKLRLWTPDTNTQGVAGQTAGRITFWRG